VSNYDEKNREALERVGTSISVIDSRLEAIGDRAANATYAQASGCRLFSERHRSRV
jgi:hypothetical protein